MYYVHIHREKKVAFTANLATFLTHFASINFKEGVIR